MLRGNLGYLYNGSLRVISLCAIEQFFEIYLTVELVAQAVVE
jgi:hypothetical protein